MYDGSMLFRTMLLTPEHKSLKQLFNHWVFRVTQ